jgi:hypothetical protein
LHACREVPWTTELYMPADLRAVGLLAAPRQDLFPYPTGLVRPTVTRVLRSGFIPSCPQSSSQFLRLFLPATPFKAAYPAKVSSLFATTPKPSTQHGSFPTPAMFRPQAFSTSRRLAPTPASWAYCIPLPRVGFVPFRGFSRFAAVPTHRRAMPPCRYQTDRSPPRRAATLGQTDFEALSYKSKRASRLVFSLPLRRSPLRIHSSFRLQLAHRELGYPSHPLVVLPPRTSG